MFALLLFPDDPWKVFKLLRLPLVFPDDNLFNPKSPVLPSWIFPLLPPPDPPFELPLNQLEEDWSSDSDPKHAYKADFIAVPIWLESCNNLSNYYDNGLAVTLSNYSYFKLTNEFGKEMILLLDTLRTLSEDNYDIFGSSAFSLFFERSRTSKWVRL